METLHSTARVFQAAGVHARSAHLAPSHRGPKTIRSPKPTSVEMPGVRLSISNLLRANAALASILHIQTS